jgi:hypothetical protein
MPRFRVTVEASVELDAEDRSSAFLNGRAFLEDAVVVRSRPHHTITRVAVDSSGHDVEELHAN